jgi:trehalose synthase
MNRVSIGRHCCAQSTFLEAYKGIVTDELLEEVRTLARALKGVRICNINSTAAGGGVAELLSRKIPVLHALGVEVDWWIIRGEEQFFTVTKGFHNALQGASYELTDEVRRIYEAQNRESARLFPDQYDVYLIHDPQPAALAHFRRTPGKRWVWRCHIDSSTPNAAVWSFLRPFVEEYDAAVFTMREFVPADLSVPRVVLIPPAIDPLSSKNMALPEDVIRRIVADSGIDLRRPLLLQVSRFDPWKDPLGVIEAYRIVKRSVPGVQLALIGALAGDDPEGWEILEQVNAASQEDRDIYVFTNLTGVGNVEVNAFQRLADVVIQKSLKEGFGLVASEALWKGSPLVAGRAGGIPMQIPEGYGRYLVEDVQECADRILELLADPEQRDAYGRAGREHIRSHFLLPRLVRDSLALVKSLL